MWRSPRYRTRDSVIPFRAFWIYRQHLVVLFATERVQMARAVSHAIALAFRKEGSGMAPITRSELKEAGLLHEG